MMARKSKSAGIALGRAAVIGAIVLTAGCSAPLVSAPVLRTPSFVDAPAYDSPRCEDARRIDAQAATWWLPSSCFKAVSAPASGT
jgi:hypothetical protein